MLERTGAAVVEKKDYARRAGDDLHVKEAVRRYLRACQVQPLVRIGWAAIPTLMESLGDPEMAKVAVIVLKELTAESCETAAQWLDWWKGLGPQSDSDNEPLPQSLRLVSCANCAEDLMGETMRYRFRRPPKGWPAFIAGRWKGRPYCQACLKLVRMLEQ